MFFDKYLCVLIAAIGIDPVLNSSPKRLLLYATECNTVLVKLIHRVLNFRGHAMNLFKPALFSLTATALLLSSPLVVAQRPDLEGVWTNKSLTGLQRPQGVEQLIASPEQALAIAARTPIAGLEGGLDEGDGVNNTPEAGPGILGCGLTTISGLSQGTISPLSKESTAPPTSSIRQMAGVPRRRRSTV